MALFNIEPDQKLHCIFEESDLMIFSIQELKNQITPYLEHTHWFFNLSQVQQCDTAGLQFLAILQHQILQAQGQVEFSNPPPCVLELKKIFGLDISNDQSYLVETEGSFNE